MAKLTATEAKLHAGEHIAGKLWGITPTTAYTDIDPGGTPPTDPGDPPPNPDENDVETFFNATIARAMARIRVACEA